MPGTPSFLLPSQKLDPEKAIENRIFIDSTTNPKIETSYDYEKINSETRGARFA